MVLRRRACSYLHRRPYPLPRPLADGGRLHGDYLHGGHPLNSHHIFDAPGPVHYRLSYLRLLPIYYYAGFKVSYQPP